MSKERLCAALFRVAVSLASIWLMLDATRPEAGSSNGTERPTAVLGLPADPDFLRAEHPRAFRFPQDHGMHPAYRNEWWYFTGHLESDDGRKFGFQLTLFRFELASNVPASASAWRTPRVLMGHFALSDLTTRQFHAYERLTRAHPALAGIEAQPLSIWLDDWSISRDAEDERWELRAAQSGVGIRLSLQPNSSTVLQGKAGLSRKSSDGPQSSYYYSIPRLRAVGTVLIEGLSVPVRGSAWLDREWGSDTAPPKQAGWDWFGLQLDDGSCLMFYRLRRQDGTIEPRSHGSLLHTNGTVSALPLGAVQLHDIQWWRSPASGRRYPSGWRLTVADHEIDLFVRPRLQQQEWRGRFPYWEGAVSISGTHTGLGYVELTGY